MTHRPELISEEWMHELTLDSLNPWAQRVGFRLFPKVTSASIRTDPRNKHVCHLFYTMGVENISKRAVNMKLLDTWQWQIHTSHAHEQGKFILLDAQKLYWMHGKFTGLHGKFTGCMAVASARMIRVHALHGANSWSVKRKSTLGQSDCRDS